MCICLCKAACVRVCVCLLVCERLGICDVCVCVRQGFCVSVDRFVQLDTLGELYIVFLHMHG